MNIDDSDWILGDGSGCDESDDDMDRVLRGLADHDRPVPVLPGGLGAELAALGRLAAGTMPVVVDPLPRQPQLQALRLPRPFDGTAAGAAILTGLVQQHRAQPGRAQIGEEFAGHLADDPADAPEPIAYMQTPNRHFRRGKREDAFDREAEGFVPADGIAWCAAAHCFHTPRLLTLDDPRDENPPGFKGRLFPPQATLLAAMRSLERRPVLAIEDSRVAPEWAPLVQTKFGRISERFSFGKTVLCLALACASRAPIRLPELTPLPTYPLSGVAATTANRAYVVTSAYGGNYDPVGVGFLPELTLRYARYLPLTVVAAAANVISQWVENTERFTDLRFFIVENVRSLREFEAMYRRGQLADYDLLFVKAGRVTTSFVVAGEGAGDGPGRRGAAPKALAKNRSLFEALSRVLDGVPVARLIVDDFDTLKLGSDDCFVPALFTWLVSATRRQTTAKAALHTGARTAEEFIRANSATGFPILGTALDDVLNKVFSLHCAPAYVDAHISSTALGFRRVFVRGGNAAVILRALEVPEEVVEMVNADAVGTAAQALGLVAHSIGDVINRVVGGHLDKLRHALRILVRAAHARVALAGRGPAELDREKVKTLRAALRDGSDAEAAAALAAVSGAGKDVLASLASLEEWAAEQKEKHGMALARMRDNIREGQCQCCALPFEKGDDAESAEAAYVLAGCCQIIVCEPCITKRDGKKKVFIKRCPNCARDIRLDTGLVRVGAELDLEAALTDEAVIGAAADLDLRVEPEEPSVANAGEKTEADPLDRVDNPKLKALLQILLGRPLDCIRDTPTPPYIAGLLDGRRDAPWPADKPKKFLVFTMHAESTLLIAQALGGLKARFSVLRGTRGQKDEAVRLLREEVSIMLVTAPKDCGGIHLPFLSHVVFYHHILDRNVEAQVAARGQRLGRENNLEILTLINEAEAADMPNH
jgi:hypothetical protein